MKTYYYCDTKLRDILHAPYVFILIDSKKEGYEIILEPTKLRRRYSMLRRHRNIPERGLNRMPDIPDREIKNIIDLCNDGKEADAKNLIMELYDEIQDGKYESYDIRGELF